MGQAWRVWAVALVGVAAGCDAFLGAQGDDAPGTEVGPTGETLADAAPSPEASPPPLRCAPDSPFTSTTLVLGLEHQTASNNAATLTADELSVVFASTRDGGVSRLFSATRRSRNDPFSPPAPVEGLGGAAAATNTPSLSPDGLTLYFATLQPTWDVYRASRARTSDAFGAAVAIGAVSTAQAEELDPFTAVGGTELWFSSSRPRDGGSGLYRVYRSVFAGASFRPAERALPGDEVDQRCPVVSSDARTLWLTRQAPEVNDGGPSIMVARRPDADAGFTGFTPVSELNVAPQQYPSWVSPDDCRLYYTRVVLSPMARAEIWVAERAP